MFIFAPHFLHLYLLIRQSPFLIQMMTVSGPALSSQSLFRSIVKDACFVAGLQGRPVVLFIQEGLSKEGMKDVASLMVEGNFGCCY